MLMMKQNEKAVQNEKIAENEKVKQNSKKMKTGNMVMVGMFAALLAVMAQVAIPMPSGIPITLQTFAMVLAGVVLGWKRGGLAVVIYLLLGAVGVPVFANFNRGLNALVGLTGGFLWGFIPLTILSGVILPGTSKFTKFGMPILFGIVGLGLCYFCGVLQFSVLQGIPFTGAFLMVSLPYLAKDIISVLLAIWIGRILRGRLNKTGLHLLPVA